jgi:phosphomannomutase
VVQRILSISGLRGIVGDGLDVDYVVQFAQALGTLANGGRVVVARDGRGTGPMIHHAVVAGLMATGCSVVDAGIAATPTCGVLVHHLQAAGGLQITASHNPIEWNGLKPFSPEGSVFNQQQGERLIAILEQQAFRRAKWNELGSIESLSEPAQPHLERIFKLIDANAIRQRRFRVVLDCNHGSGSVLGIPLLEQLGCTVHVLGSRPDGQFEHTPEPLAENLTGLCRAVKAQGADVGFAQDPDADRLAIVDNCGRYIGEELTLSLCADHVLARRPGPLVVNGSTSRVTADVAAKYKCPFYRSYVGEAHVVAKMKEVSAVLGGEGNGGVIEPNVGYVRDSFVSMAYVLDGLAATNGTVAEWADSLPQYTIVKQKLTCPRDKVGQASSALRSAYKDADAKEGDGLRLDWSDRWVQVRGSNTEPIIRIIAEAPGSDQANRLCDEAVEIVRKAVGATG